MMLCRARHSAKKHGGLARNVQRCGLQCLFISVCAVDFSEEKASTLLICRVEWRSFETSTGVFVLLPQVGGVVL